MPSTSLTRVIVSVESLDEALAFYCDLIGLPVQERSGDIATLAAGSSSVLLHQRPSTPSVAAVATCFSVGDLDRTVGAWQERHGEVVDPPAEQPWGEHMAVVKDPDGHIVCLVQA